MSYVNSFLEDKTIQTNMNKIYDREAITITENEE
jgi:hypothetical protein